MDFRALQKTVARGIVELDIVDDYVEAIASLKEWGDGLRKNRIRVWQCLADNTSRNFDASWVLMALRFFAYCERHDLCQEMNGAMMAAQWEGDRMREEGLPIRKLRTVRPGRVDWERTG